MNHELEAYISIDFMKTNACLVKSIDCKANGEVPCRTAVFITT